MKKFILFSIVSLSALFSSAQCVADFTWSTSGGIVNFTNNSSGANNFNWSFGDGSYSNNFTTSHVYSTPGTYDVCLYVYYDDSVGVFCDDSICQQITVQDTSGGSGCTANMILSQNGMQIVATNASFGSSNFTWNIYDYLTGNQVANGNGINLYFNTGYYADYLVCLTAYDSLGFVCDTLCDIITISDSNSASVTSISLFEFQLYPNPTNSVLNLKFDQLPSNTHARIVDLLGREMTQADLTGHVTEINVADFPSGMYLVQLIDSNKQVIGMHKFLRE